MKGKKSDFDIYRVRYGGGDGGGDGGGGGGGVRSLST